MLAKLKSFTLVGIHAMPVEVEVDVSPRGLPAFILVGMPDQAVKESKHRVYRAMQNSGYQIPTEKTIVNLALSADCRIGSGDRRVLELFNLLWMGKSRIVKIEFP